MANFITDGDFTVESAVSDYRFSAPFASYGIKDLYIVEQDFVINRANFSPLDIDTAHPTLADYYLAIETPMQAVSIEGTVRWTRRYSKVPASFSRPAGTYAYSFPVMLTGTNSTSRLSAKPLTVNARMQVDFFHTSDPDSITVIPPQRFVLATNTDTDSTSQYGEPVVADSSSFLAETVPNLTTYKGWIASGMEIVVEASKITPNWMGNIHMRETLYVKAT